MEKTIIFKFLSVITLYLQMHEFLFINTGNGMQFLKINEK